MMRARNTRILNVALVHAALTNVRPSINSSNSLPATSLPVFCFSGEKLHHLILESVAGIADGPQGGSLEVGDTDYQEAEPEGDFERNEKKRRESEFTKKKWSLWSPNRCERLPSTSEEDGQEHLSNTTDPLLSHELLVPYDRMPKPRFFCAAGKDVEYIASSLPRRPRSPVRTILPGKFDLAAAFEEWEAKQRIYETKEHLKDSKGRIASTLKRLSEDHADEDVVISTVIVQAICEQVILMTDTRLGIDTHTFVDIATIWALTDLDLLDYDALTEIEFMMLKELRSSHSNENSNITADSWKQGFRKTLQKAYRRNFGVRAYASMHRRLPWPFLGPAHEMGHTKFYPNVRERIDERIPEAREQLRSAYVPDLTCFHVREVPGKAYVAYKRRSKSLADPGKSQKNFEKLLVQLVSFV